jgi:hypothetical protein
MHQYSSIESALFGLYNLSDRSKYKTTDFSKIDDAPGVMIFESKIPCESMVLAGAMIDKIENLCYAEEKMFMQVFYGWLDVRISADKLFQLASVISPNCIKLAELCILAYRNPQSRKYELYAQGTAITGLDEDSVKNKIYRMRKKLKELRARFVDTDYSLSHSIEKKLAQNELLNYLAL